MPLDSAWLHSNTAFMTGTKRQLITGGVQISMDIHKAYDRPPRQHLERAPQAAQIAPHLIEAIMAVLYTAVLKVTHAGKEGMVHTGRGVRQGCGLSPLLWAIYSKYALQCVAGGCGQSWLTSGATAYADDFLMAWDIEKPSDIDRFQEQVTTAFRILQGLGLKISADKTVVILGIAGTKADKLIGRLLINKPGRAKYLRLIVNGEPMDIKAVKEHVYLGVKISYHKFEQSTLTYRLQLANTAFRRLESVLRSKVVGSTKRLHLWKACVMSCLQHGLTSVGLQGDGEYDDQGDQ